MRTIDGLFESWDTITEMAHDLGKTRAAVEKWQTRQRIPSSAWPAVIKALKRKGKDIGAAELLAMHSKPTRSKRPPVAQPYNGGDAA